MFPKSKEIIKSYSLSIVDELAKSKFFRFDVIPANPGSRPGQAPESSKFNEFWMPDQVRHDDSGLFTKRSLLVNSLIGLKSDLIFHHA
jgi:hypothetical protein